MRLKFPAAPGWAFPILALCGIVNVVCAIALLGWKKWGFFGFVVTAIVIFAINLMTGLSIARALLGLVSIAILFLVLQIGEEKKGWTQLE